MRDADGRIATATLVTPNAYSLTADAVVRIVTQIGGVTPGAHTPATAFGPAFLKELEDVTVGAITVIS